MSERKGMLLRLDPAVHDALAKWAADELRSTNAQIEFLLRRALAEAAGCPGTRTGCAGGAGRRPPPGPSSPATRQPPRCGPRPHRSRAMPRAGRAGRAAAGSLSAS